MTTTEQALHSAPRTLHADGESRATRLRPDWDALLAATTRLGRVRLVVSSAHAALARCVDLRDLAPGDRGAPNLRVDGMHLTLQVHAWGNAFAVERSSPLATFRSLRVFDRYGAPAVELFVSEANRIAFDTMVADLRADDAGAPAPLAPEPAPAAERPNDDIDVRALREGWDALGQGRSFKALLDAFGLTRTQAYRLAGGTRAESIVPGALAGYLSHAARCARPIGLRVANRGAVLTAGARLLDSCAAHPWLDAAGRCISLRVRESAIAEAWIALRPGDDAPRMTMEFFDQLDRPIVSVGVSGTDHFSEDADT